jgi:hypothetical protein
VADETKSKKIHILPVYVVCWAPSIHYIHGWLKLWEGMKSDRALKRELKMRNNWKVVRP